MRPQGRSVAKGRSQGWRRVGPDLGGDAVSVAGDDVIHWRGALILFLSCFFLFLGGEKRRKNKRIRGVHATEIWSAATDLRLRAYRFMVTCYRNMVLSTAVPTCCYRFMVRGVLPLQGPFSATDLWFSGGSWPPATDLWSSPSCYRFMVGRVPGGTCYRFMVDSPAMGFDYKNCEMQQIAIR